MVASVKEDRFGRMKGEMGVVIEGIGRLEAGMGAYLAAMTHTTKPLSGRILHRSRVYPILRWIAGSERLFDVCGPIVLARESVETCLRGVLGVYGDESIQGDGRDRLELFL